MHHLTFGWTEKRIFASGVSHFTPVNNMKRTIFLLHRTIKTKSLNFFLLLQEMNKIKSEDKGVVCNIHDATQHTGIKT